MSDRPPVTNLTDMVKTLSKRQGQLENIIRGMAAALVDQQQRAADQRPAYLSRRMATVTAINDPPGGPITADVDLGGATVPEVASQGTYRPHVGDLVWLEFSGPDPHISPPLTTQAARRWTELTPDTGWTQGIVPKGAAACWRDMQGVVYLRGYMAGGSSPSLMTTLPEGYRPATSLSGAQPCEPTFLVPARSGGAIVLGHVWIQGGGQVLYTGPAAPTEVHLNGVTFRTD